MCVPRLKNPLLCRITSYVVFPGAFIAPMVAAICIPVLSDLVKAIVSMVCIAGLLVYLFRHFGILMGMDIALGIMQGYVKAYRQYPLKPDTEALEKRLSRFGKGCTPMALQPQPYMLRYKSTAPITIYSSGIEKVVAVYRCALLTKGEYHSILSSAVANSKTLTGKKKHLLLDKEQKASPLNRVTVILILASAVEPELSKDLFDLVCKQEGDGFDEAVLPCIMDLSAKTCVFNSPRLPYIGMQYPVKNRGIRLIERHIFGGSLPKGQGKLIEEVENFDPETTLWSFYRSLKREWHDENQRTRKKLKKMFHGEILVEQEQILLKWGERGIDWALRWEEETAVVTVTDIWDYPKVRPMSQKHLGEVKDRISYHFAKEGKTVRFVTLEEEE